MPLTPAGKLASGVVAGCAAAAILGFAYTGQHRAANTGIPTPSSTSVAVRNPASVAGQPPAASTRSGSPARAVASSSSSGTAAASSSSSPAAPGVDPKQVQQAEALTTAQQFSVAYARPSGGPNLYAWWDTVQEFLTPQAIKGPLHRKPQDSPYTKVTGIAKVVGSTPNIRHKGPRDYLIDVPTDKGTWHVQVTTQQSDRPLVVSASLRPAKKKPTKKPTSGTSTAASSSTKPAHK